MAFNFGKMPKTLTCWICGRGFGTASLKIHIKTCQQKWEVEEAKKPKNQRRPCPKPPAGLLMLMEKGSSLTNEDIQRANEQAYDQYDKESLMPCENCGRTFGYDQLQRHKKICTADRPMNKLNRPADLAAPGGGGAGGVSKPVAAAKMGGGAGVSKPLGAAKTGGGAPARFAGGSNPVDSMPIGGSKGGDYNYDDDDGGANVNLVPCSKCGRNFAEDRISKHERTCKVNAKPKKVKMFHKPITEKEKAKMDAVKEKTSKWRQQHQDFVQAMKYNRQVQAVEERGGDIRKMAPPPPSSNAGMTPCPYCGRNFGEVQAARHIPSCKNTINKPKAPPARAAPAGPSYGGGYGAPASKPSGPSMGSGYGMGPSKPVAQTKTGTSRVDPFPTKAAPGPAYSSPYTAGPSKPSGTTASKPPGMAASKPPGMGVPGNQANNYRKKF